MTQEKLNSLPEEYKDIYVKLCMQVDLDISLDSVILSKDNRAKIEDFIKETEYKEKFIEYGLKPVNRLIFYGASGTGKTYLSKALANHFGYEMLYIDIASALRAGIAAQSIESVFELGNYLGNCIIFLDECDAICWARDDKDNDDDASIRRANNALFQQLDQMNPSCIFISATNLYDNLDPAFVRRFNTPMEFFRPPLSDLDKTINKFLLPKFEYDMDLQKDIKEIILFHARTYTGLSYYGIKDWVERAEKDALIHDTNVVKESTVFSYFMQAMRIKIGEDGRGKPALYQYSE